MQDVLVVTKTELKRRWAGRNAHSVDKLSYKAWLKLELEILVDEKAGDCAMARACRKALGQ